MEVVYKGTSTLQKRPSDHVVRNNEAEKHQITGDEEPQPQSKRGK